jgi:hypothetical protein
LRLQCSMAEPFNANELIALLRGLEQRGIAYEVEYRRATDECDGIAVRILFGVQVWEVGFYENNLIEVLRFTLAGEVEPGVTAASLLADLDVETQEER